MDPTQRRKRVLILIMNLRATTGGLKAMDFDEPESGESVIVTFNVQIAVHIYFYLLVRPCVVGNL